jgi:hypothetical protein
MTMKMINASMGGLLLMLLSSYTAPAQAFGVSNGSFETGSFTDWDTFSSGNETVVNNTAICGSATPCSGSPADAYLQVGPVASPIPTASVLNYANVPNLNVANGIILPICNPLTASCANDLNVQANQASVQLVVDVVGYFK